MRATGPPRIALASVNGSGARAACPFLTGSRVALAWVRGKAYTAPMIHPDRLGARVNNWALLGLAGLCFLLYELFPIPFIRSDPALVALSIIAGCLIGIVLPFFLITRRLGIPFRSQFQLHLPSPWPALAVVGATLSLAPLLDLITWRMSLRFPPNPAYLEFVDKFRPDDPLRFTLVAIALALMVPLAEEMLFRGVLQRVLLRQSGPALAIILTACLFAAVHPLYSLPGVLLLGLFFGVMAYLLGNLIYPIIAHAVWNLLNLLVLKNAPDDLTVATPFREHALIWCLLSLMLFVFFSRFWLRAKE